VWHVCSHKRPIFQSRIRVDFSGMLQKFLYDDVWHHLDSVLALTSTIYGSSELPTQIMQSLHSLYSERVAHVGYQLNKAFGDDFVYLRNAGMWPENPCERTNDPLHG
jgi:hypothetical protein